jgi:lipoate-protein ligase A
MKTWRLLDTPAMTAAENMALDDALVELRGKEESPNTIHFLQFYPRCVLVGFHQSIDEEIREEYCRTHGIEINRRITGGGAIFFDESQLGWEVICDKAFFNVTIPDHRLFKILCDPVIAALDLLGVASSFRPRNDIEVNGRKISGTGGTESEGAFLFQGTMLVDFDVETMLRSLKIPVEKLKAKEIDSIKERVTCLRWELGYTPPIEAIKQAVRTGFEKKLGIRLEPGGLTGAEQRLFEEKLTYYRSRRWIDHVKPKFRRQEVIQSAYKADGGMVRFTLVLNPAGTRLKNVFITGDFLSFPTRALFDMESRLRGLPLDRNRIRRAILEFFDDEKIKIPGMDCIDFLKPLDQAFEKIAVSRFGIPLEYCNQISVTNGTFEEILRKRPSVLLLPYCSKSTDCDLRNRKGCRVCGECTIGPAWSLGRKKGMRAISIQSFEDLLEELVKMKSAGDPAFIGCCCQPFYAKHVDDFEKAGVPGILIHIDCTTCYELDQAKDAYAGKFESQTEIDLDLLRAILDLMPDRETGGGCEDSPPPKAAAGGARS